MSLSDLADAQHHAQLAGRQSALVRVHDGARVAHRRALDRELLGERGPEQEPPVRRHLDVRGDTIDEAQRVTFEHRREIAVARPEPDDQLVERTIDVSVGQPEDVGDGVRRAPFALAGQGMTGDEQLPDHA